MPIFYVSLLWNCGIMAKRLNLRDDEMDWYRSMVKQIWWNGTDNTPMFTWWNGEIMKWCNGETIILTFGSRLLLGSLRQWGPIPLLHFIGCCIPCQGTHRLWMMPCWSSKWPMSRFNTLWCRIPPLLSSKWFLLLLPPDTANTGGGRPLCHLTDSCHWLLFLYWQYN